MRKVIDNSGCYDEDIFIDKTNIEKNDFLTKVISIITIVIFAFAACYFIHKGTK
jgi:hypothetical protein